MTPPPGRELVGFRFADYGTALRVESARIDTRFARAADPEPTQYLSLHPLGPLAELIRGSRIDTTAKARLISARLWVVRVRGPRLPEVSFGTARRHGIEPDELVGDDYRPCWELAAAMRRRHPGMIVPSAALPGTRNLVLFGIRVAAPWELEPIAPIDVPASLTTAGGRPPTGLVAAVRFRGCAHAGLEAWRRGRRFVLDEAPLWAFPEPGL